MRRLYVILIAMLVCLNPATSPMAMATGGHDMHSSAMMGAGPDHHSVECDEDDCGGAEAMPCCAVNSVTCTSSETVLSEALATRIRLVDGVKTGSAFDLPLTGQTPETDTPPPRS